MSNRIWLRYEKKDLAKYISHLDFVRAMNRTLRRGEVPVSYSQGFNPHPKLSFALPLSLGTTSNCELIELEVDTDMAPEEIIERLNSKAPVGLKFVDGGILEDKKMFNKIGYAKYQVTPDIMPSESQIEDFLKRDNMVVKKKTKSGINETDIRKDIDSIKIEDTSLIMVLAAGNEANLKPETVILAMNTYIEGLSIDDYDCERTGILDKNKKYV
ncbi:MAG: TIGR03936 family radical SAM-associated protein [Bacillota bacterium]|nr:TIGR03936 family radical SAM-associated protein [Bacillota bacterium]